MRRGLAVLALTGAMVSLAAPAWAHAGLVAVHPGTTAGTVVLEFSEQLDAAHSTVTVAGAPQALHPVGPRSLEVTVPAGGADVAWRVVSADDGHAVSGAQALGAAELAPAAQEQPVADPGTLSTHLLLAARLAQYLALVVAVGGLGFVGLVWPAGGAVRRARRLLGGAVVVGLVSAVAGVGLQQTALLDVGPSALQHLGTWKDAVDGHVGQVWGARALLWLLTVPLLRALALQGEAAARSRGWRAGSLVVSLGLVRAIGLISHGEASAHPTAGGIADAVHVAAAALWLGGLAFLVLVVLPRRDADELAAVLPRYSWLALGSVTAVVAAGTALSWDLVGGLDPLLTTGYGHRLLVKLALVGALLLAAQQSKSFVQSRLDLAVVLGGDRAVLRPLVLSVTAEAVLAAAVLSAAAVLATGSPVR